MKIQTTYIMQLLIALLLLSCQKADVPFFEGEDAVYISASSQMYGQILVNQRPANTISQRQYNFGYQFDEVLEDTIRFPVRVMGRVHNRDRSLAVAVVADSTNATEGLDYRLLPSFIPANKLDGWIEVLVLRNAGLGAEPKKLQIQLMTNTDFPRYAYLDSINVYNRANIFLFDVFRKPDDWDGIVFEGDYYEGYGLGFHLGDYSETKFRLVIEVAGTADIIPYFLMRNYRNVNPKPPGYFEYEEWRVLVFKLQTRLIEYRQEHGRPMLDENGEEVTFPPF